MATSSAVGFRPSIFFKTLLTCVPSDALEMLRLVLLTMTAKSLRSVFTVAWSFIM